MKLLFILTVIGLTAGCTGNSCNPPPILLPLLLPVALVDRIAHPPRPHAYRPILGGDSIGNAFVLNGSMTEEALRSQETYFYWTDRDYRIPGSAIGRFEASADPRKVEGVVYRNDTTHQETTYYFDLTDLKLTKQPEQTSQTNRGLRSPVPEW